MGAQWRGAVYPYLGRSPECYEAVSPHYELCCSWGIYYWPEVKGRSHRDVHWSQQCEEELTSSMVVTWVWLELSVSV